MTPEFWMHAEKAQQWLPKETAWLVAGIPNDDFRIVCDQACACGNFLLSASAKLIEALNCLKIGRGRETDLKGHRIEASRSLTFDMSGRCRLAGDCPLDGGVMRQPNAYFQSSHERLHAIEKMLGIVCGDSEYVDPFFCHAKGVRIAVVFPSGK